MKNIQYLYIKSKCKMKNISSHKVIEKIYLDFLTFRNYDISFVETFETLKIDDKKIDILTE